MTIEKTKIEKRGGARPGAGRPLTGREPKKPLPAKVTEECRSDVKALSKKLGTSQAEVIQRAVKIYKDHIDSNPSGND
ncbi:hypothetical protein [Marinagarivorans cellulosilyticus]|uniref:hypothetical protein n=1 Tax=Marinagarivorans cellulosilyticus TaxID=2721545 RepID=UPI001F3CE0F3|nr:hypothetical protein [Marinagarivorans cellulosilyticus]